MLTPIEAPTLSALPSTVNGRARTDRMRCASTAASSGAFRPGDSRTKSSPPTPPQRVLAAQWVLQPVGDRAQQRVARLVAERVVHQLEAVEVDAEHRELGAAGRPAEARLA